MKTHTVRMEWRVQHMIWPIWRFWVTTDHRRRRRSRRRRLRLRLRLCVDVVMSLAVEDPRGTTTLPSQTHTHTCAYQNPFWVTKSHVRESVFFRIGLRPVGSEPTARSRAIDQSWRWKSHAGPKSTTNTISPYILSCLVDAPRLSDSSYGSLEEWFGGNPKSECKLFPFTLGPGSELSLGLDQFSTCKSVDQYFFFFYQ